MDIIDRGALDRLLNVIGGDEEDLQELIDDFLETTPEMLQKMRAAAAADDISTLRINAHSLKSNSKDFGALALAGLCEALEHACRDGTPADAGAQVDGIAAALGEARRALADLVNKNG